MKRWVAILCAVALMMTALPMLTFGTAVTAEVITEVEGVRWFPVPAEKQNDAAWEVECFWDGCYCQGFNETPETTGFANYLDTDWGENGELTVTRNGNDGKGDLYWPRFRTLLMEAVPELDITEADTLYFNFDVAEGTTWNLMLTFNGLHVKLSKVIADAAGKSGTVANSDTDGGSGHFEGSVNLQDALYELAMENGTESSWNAPTILSASTLFVPQLSVYCVGAVGASLTVNELYLSTADDTDGANTRLVDMGLLTGMGEAYYAEPTITEVDSVRWFPVPAERQNDAAWEAECYKDGCYCQGFNETPETTGFANYLDTDWGKNGELTVTRNGNDGTSGVYWPRIRTVAVTSAPRLDIKKADTLYFDFDVAAGTTWNLMLNFNGFHVKLSKVIADAAGKSGTVAHSDLDGGSGRFKGKVNLQDALYELAMENGTESSSNAPAIMAMTTTCVPQLSLLCVGAVGASLTVNELYLSTADDTDGADARLVDMGLLTGLGGEYYGWTYGDFSYEPNEDGTACITAYSGTAQDVTVPAVVDGYTVTAIGDGAFGGDAAMETLMLPDTLSAIGEAAFVGCDALTDVYFDGSDVQWKAIAVGANNECLAAATVHYAAKALGDLSGDGKLNTLDALLLYGGVNGRRTLTDAQTAVSDITGDGKVNTMDALLLYKTVSGK